MRYARSGAKTVTERAARELRGCGVMYAIRWHDTKPNAADPRAVRIEGGDSTAGLPEGFAWVYGTGRVCMRPFGHDGSNHTGWSRELVTDKPRHSGPRVPFKRAVRADRMADYLPTPPTVGRAGSDGAAHSPQGGAGQ